MKLTKKKDYSTNGRLFNNHHILDEFGAVGVIGRAHTETTEYTFIAKHPNYSHLETLPATKSVNEMLTAINETL